VKERKGKKEGKRHWSYMDKASCLKFLKTEHWKSALKNFGKQGKTDFFIGRTELKKSQAMKKKQKRKVIKANIFGERKKRQRNRMQ
jgi:UDP-N-acetylglucosamine 2-epimerase